MVTGEPTPGQAHAARLSVRDRWSRTVLIGALGILAVTVIAMTRDLNGTELGMCLMAIREAVGLVAGRPGAPGAAS